jgi:hypothetical protein
LHTISTSQQLNGNNIQFPHDIEGNLTQFVTYTMSGYTKKYTLRNFVFNGKYNITVYGLFTNGEKVASKAHYGTFENIIPNALVNNRSVVPVTATSFTDEDNPVMSYSTTTGQCLLYNPTTKAVNVSKDSINILRAALSFDGINPAIDWRDIPVGSYSYTFVLTDEERELLRILSNDAAIKPIYYLIKVRRYSGGGDYPTVATEPTSATERTLTIVGCTPTINPMVVDANSTTAALTGDNNIVVRYASMMEFAINATASKHATIVSQSVRCGSKTVSDLSYGIIDDVESGTFIFDATDSRGLKAETAIIEKPLVEYIKPTINQTITIELTSEKLAQINLKLKGNYYNGSFGAVDNSIQLDVRYKSGSAAMNEWQPLSGELIFTEGGYEFTTTFKDFDYAENYVFQCRIIDKLYTVEAPQYAVKLLPIFDWSENDFNFNVPININAEAISLNEEQIIRHNATANNVVLAATGNTIYLRPGGTDETQGEVSISKNGDIKINGETLADYVIAEGTVSMGSNGTWYWRKWLSGRAECYGQRNFGAMAITTAWGGLFRSAAFTQALPEGLFIEAPQTISIELNDSDFGGWIAKHETAAPTNSATGSFIVVRPASATLSSSYIGFNIIGRWR